MSGQRPGRFLLRQRPGRFFSEMFESIVVSLGGRIAEKIFLDDISTGASGDIQEATQVARNMVTVYGMSERLGPISFDSSGHSIFIGRDFGQTKSYSEETAAIIDEEVKLLFDEAASRCEEILRAHADILEGVVSYLMEHETMDGPDFAYYCEHGTLPPKPEEKAAAVPPAAENDAAPAEEETEPLPDAGPEDDEFTGEPADDEPDGE